MTVSDSDSRALDLFRETFSRRTPDERQDLERLADWAHGLQDEGVAELEFVRLKDVRPHLLVRPIRERALASISRWSCFTPVLAVRSSRRLQSGGSPGSRSKDAK